MKFFVMYAQTCIEDYVLPGEEILQLERGCINSEFQFLDHSPISVEISDEGGEDFPDFLIYDGIIPLITENFRQVLDRAGVNNLFYKPVNLTSDAGYSENYYLALPPRIDCLNFLESVVEVEKNNFAQDDELIKEVVEIVIDENKIGNYKIFKLPAGFVNQEIIVTEKLKTAIEKANLENVYFAHLKEV